ncbi:MAG: SRPBCC domain-containing protein, partial [Leptospira sp.]|nr:SRPBCC domain-containing protein [Leptospira sp.]
IQIEIFYPYSRELVWDALTDPGALREWAMDNNFKPIVGYKFQFRAKPNKFWNGIIDGEILEVKKPSRLAYTWRTNNAKESTTVTWTLETSGNGTNVKLQHSGFKGVGGFIFSKLILANGWKKQITQYIPVILDHIKRNGLKFEKGKWLIAERIHHFTEGAN